METRKSFHFILHLIVQSLQPVTLRNALIISKSMRCKRDASVRVVDDVVTHSTNQRLCLQTASVAFNSAICHVSELEQLGDDTTQELLFDKKKKNPNI